MEIKTELKDDVLIFYLNGNLLGEHANAPVMQKLKETIESGKNKILFNLSELKFINSTGLGMLLTALTKARNAGGELTLTNVPEQMNKLLIMTKLKDIFNIHPDEKSGLEFLKNC
ncbi:MAG: STAS domain-containing protein [Chitinophagales bacterium]|nr:STAS domain-containing protein [Chitinophagales bacterium]MDW8274560.1 STAS domain-containing protein [Chitinophagales bacterium]